MEQVRGEANQQEQTPTPLKCPRCNSLDTKFRYFNNHNLAQPRHYCKTCKRQWTVGGNLRNIPVGGKPRSNKKTKASSSRCTNPPQQPPLPQGEENLQNPQPLTHMAPMLPQDLDTTMAPPVPNIPTTVLPLSSYDSNDEISLFDFIQSLIQPYVIDQHVNVGYQFSGGGANMAIPGDGNIPSMASQQALPQQIPSYVEAYQTANQVNNSTPQIYDNSLVQPNWPMSSLPQDVTNDFCFPTSNVGLRNNSTGNTTDTNMEMDTNSVNVDEWLNFPGYGSS